MEICFAASHAAARCDAQREGTRKWSTRRQTGHPAGGSGSAWSAAAATPSSAPCIAWRCGSTIGSSWSPARCRPIPDNAAASAAEIGLAPDRSYADYRDMAASEAARPDGIEAVVIVTPNHLHAPIATAFLEAGIDVICDKPLSTTLAEAEALVALTARDGANSCVTLNNTGYAMVRQAREMVAAGELGGIGRRTCRLYPGLADQADRRRRPEAGGVAHRSGARRPVGSACRHRRPRLQPRLLRLRPRGGRGCSRSVHRRARPPARRQCACPGALVGRGARHHPGAARPRPATTTTSPSASMATRPASNGPALRPEELRFSPYGEETPHPGRAAAMARSARPAAVSRMPAAHPEGYIEAFANLYRDAAEIIRATAAAAAVDPDRGRPGARRRGRRPRRQVRGGGGGLEPCRRSLDGGAVRLRSQALASKASTSRLACARIQPLTVRTTLPFESWLSVK